MSERRSSLLPERDAPRVLVADESTASRRVMARLVRRAGYEPIEADSITEARARRLEERDNLVAAVLEAHMPEGLALSFCTQLLSGPAPCASVLVGDERLGELAATAILNPVHKLMRKPFDPSHFHEALESAVARTREIRRWLDPEVCGERHDSWIDAMAAGEANPDQGTPGVPFLTRMSSIVVQRGQLSPAMARIVPDLLLGRDYATIAASHGIGVETVRSHVKSILSRLNLGSAREIWQVCVERLDS